MIIYHGSYMEVAAPDLVHSRKAVDFGPGFYTTPIYEQARKWCNRFQRRHQSGVISVYEMDEKMLESLLVLSFDAYSEEWLDFIVKCRRKEDISSFDVVIGGIANDKVFNTLELFFDGLIDKKETIRRLRYEKPNLQICFRTERALQCIRFVRSEVIC